VRPSFEHHYRKLLEVQVTVEKQTPTLEVYELEVVRAEARSERITDRVFSPGAKLRLTFTPGDVTVDPPVTQAERRLLSEAFSRSLAGTLRSRIDLRSPPRERIRRRRRCPIGHLGPGIRATPG
jgi:hypothetical protein